MPPAVPPVESAPPVAPPDPPVEPPLPPPAMRSPPLPGVADPAGDAVQPAAAKPARRTETSRTLEPSRKVAARPRSIDGGYESPRSRSTHRSSSFGPVMLEKNSCTHNESPLESLGAT